MTTKYSWFAVDLNHLISLLYIHITNILIIFTWFTNLGSHSHFYINVIYLFSIIYFIFTFYRTCSITLTRDWLISYLASHLNSPFRINYFIHNTHVTHTFPEEERFTRSKYWIYQVFSNQYLLCCDPYLQFSCNMAV